MKTKYLNTSHIMHSHYSISFLSFISNDYNHLVDYSYMPLSKCSLTCELMNVSNN